jgi:hypothetical protein
MNSPVLFLIFNRPRHTQASFSAIRNARPPRLYVAADGPRPGRKGEEELCHAARRIIEQVDWPCDVSTLFREKNIGGPRGIPQALEWFFSREEEGVILEDDIVCHADFFVFCDMLLEKYRSNLSIMHITGNNHQLGLRHGDASYFFSKTPHTWGWATWARAWNKFRSVISNEEIVAFIVKSLLPICVPEKLGYVPEMMLSCAENAVGHWDARWWYSVAACDGLVPMPNVPLTRNIGYGETATHTNKKSLLQSIPLAPLGKIVHPSEITWSKYADEVDYRIVFTGIVNTPQGLANEVRLRVAHGDPEQSIQFLVKIVQKFFADKMFPTAL